MSSWSLKNIAGIGQQTFCREDILSGPAYMFCREDILSGRHFVWTILCDIFFRRSGLDVLSGPPHGWLLVRCGYEWLWMVMGWFYGGNGWFQVVTCGYKLLQWFWGDG